MTCHRFHVVYLEANAKCCHNFVKFKKRQLSFTYQSTIKKCLPEWDRAIPLMKKVRFSCMSDNLIKCRSKWETWIKVGWKHHPLVMSIRMVLNNSCNLLNIMHHLCMGNFSVHVLNEELVMPISDDIRSHLICQGIIPNYTKCDVAPCRACRPWIFFTNGVICFLKINVSGMEKEERWLETSLQGEDESRKGSPP